MLWYERNKASQEVALPGKIIDFVSQNPDFSEPLLKPRQRYSTSSSPSLCLFSDDDNIRGRYAAFLKNIFTCQQTRWPYQPFEAAGLIKNLVRFDKKPKFLSTIPA